LNKNDFYEFLINKIEDNKIILFGELHGTKEIPMILSNFFDKFVKNNNFNIFMEIPDEEQENVNNFLLSGDEKLLLQTEFFKNNYNNDGRNSLEYFEFIKNIYLLNKKFKKKIKIFCIDISNITLVEERDNIMANNVIKNLEKEFNFVIVGNLHASKKCINFDDFCFKTLGSFIYKNYKNQMISINILPETGQFFNNSIEKVPDLNEFKEISKNYDYTYFIENSSCCSFLKKN